MELPENLKLVIFDFDGTLHSLELDWTAVRRAAGIADTDEKLGDAMERLKEEKDEARLKAITDIEVRSVAAKAFEPQITRLLNDLKKDYRLAILTRNSRLAVGHMLQNSGLEDIFVTGREDVTRLKPHAEGVNKILQRFNTQPTEAILIGDTHHDVEAARNAGISCLIVGKNYQSSGGLESPAQVNNFSEIAKLLRR